MASRLLSPLPDGVSQFRKKPKCRVFGKKKRLKQSIHVRQNTFKRTPLKRAGRKTKEWESIRRVLVKRFLKAGLWRCELGYVGCWQINALGFAHAKKRRNCSEKDLWTAIICCNFCHDQIEILPESEMQKLVLKIIAARPVQP